MTPNAGREGHRVLVALPPGLAEVRLNRWGLDLAERGGFDAVWAEEAELAREVLTLEAYRLLAKRHLREVYRSAHGRDPAATLLNLASHALSDDLVGWSKLNHRA